MHPERAGQFNPVLARSFLHPNTPPQPHSRHSEVALFLRIYPDAFASKVYTKFHLSRKTRVISFIISALSLLDLPTPVSWRSARLTDI